MTTQPVVPVEYATPSSRYLGWCVAPVRRFSFGKALLAALIIYVLYRFGVFNELGYRLSTDPVVTGVRDFLWKPHDLQVGVQFSDIGSTMGPLNYDEVRTMQSIPSDQRRVVAQILEMTTTDLYKGNLPDSYHPDRVKQLIKEVREAAIVNIVQQNPHADIKADQIVDKSLNDGTGQGFLAMATAAGLPIEKLSAATGVAPDSLAVNVEQRLAYQGIKLDLHKTMWSDPGAIIFAH